LRRLLDAYDRANRLEIDAVYAQFSPTLDDYYVEELRIDVPDVAAGRPAAAVPAEVRPEIVLTRTVPGLRSRSVRAPGAPFPLAQAYRLVQAALAASQSERGRALRAAVDGGSAWLALRQVPRTQRVRLLLEPGEADALALLTAL
jgi:hypothetical protein